MDREEIAAWSLGAVGAVGGVYKYYIHPEVENRLERLSVPHNAAWGWAGIVFGVAAYDYLAMRDDRETLSHAFRRGMEHPAWRFLCVGAIGATALHLANVLPRELDVFYGFKKEE